MAQHGGSTAVEQFDWVSARSTVASQFCRAYQRCISTIRKFRHEESMWLLLITCQINASILQLPDSPLVPTNITSTVQINNSTATSPSTSTSSIPSSNTSKHLGLSTGAKAGIGAGVGVGIALLLGIILFWLLRRKKNKSAGRFGTNPPSYDGWSTNVNKDNQNMEEASRVPLVEAHSEMAVEAPSNPGRYELAGDFERYGEVMSPGASPTSERTMVEPDRRFA